MHKPGKERRKFERLPAHHLLKYKIIGQGEDQGILSFVRNISAGGLLFHSEGLLAADSIIELEVVINFPTRPEPIKVLAKVLRSSPLKKIGGYDVAIEFINLDDITRDFIRKKISNVYAQITPVKRNIFLKKIFVILLMLTAMIWVLIKFAPVIMSHLKK